MKLIKHIIIPIITATLLSSCADGPSARTVTVIGALGGAAAGGIIGTQRGRGLEGAAIGAGLGGAAGNVIGGAQDQRRREYYNTRY